MYADDEFDGCSRIGLYIVLGLGFSLTQGIFTGVDILAIIVIMCFKYQ